MRWHFATRKQLVGGASLGMAYSGPGHTLRLSSVCLSESCMGFSCGFQKFTLHGLQAWSHFDATGV